MTNWGHRARESENMRIGSIFKKFWMFLTEVSENVKHQSYGSENNTHS